MKIKFYTLTSLFFLSSLKLSTAFPFSHVHQVIVNQIVGRDLPYGCRVLEKYMSIAVSKHRFGKPARNNAGKRGKNVPLLN
jgi:hypothetical protein